MSFFLTLLFLGVLITFLGLLQWNLSTFIGLSKEEDPLNTHGIYSLTRHPVYSGLILIFLSTLLVELTANTLSWVLGAGGYFVRGSVPEDNKLQTLHQKYDEYMVNVGRFFPWRKRHIKFFLNRK